MSATPIAYTSREFRHAEAVRLADRIEAAASDEEVSAALWSLNHGPQEVADSSVAIILEANTLLAARIARWLQT